ncbi:MAG: tetratricopeptide repeat protein [Burkholderiaceae bacterium]
MSLLMQALKKAEHAKQKQSTPSQTEGSEEKPLLTIQQDDIALPPQENSPPSPAVNLDMLDMELSPVAQENTQSIEAESAITESVYSPEPAKSFIAPESAEPSIDSPYTTTSRSNSYTEKPFSDNGNRSEVEISSQQLTAKMRLEQQKAAALEAGKLQAEQQKAKAVFASKKTNTNKRTLWIAVIGLLVVIVFFGGGYYYVQLTPQNSTLVVKTLPIQVAPAPAPAVLADVTPAKDTPNDAAPIQTAVVAQKNVPSTTDNQPRQTTQKTSIKPDTEQASAQRNSPAANGAEAIQFRQTTVDSHINPALSKAYQFFMNGDLTAAQQQYQAVLQQEPNNHDALLGMASIAISRKQGAQAGSFYMKLLELDPNDPDAIAGLTSLQGGDPSEMESRLKKALTQSPQAGSILFALGNLYAQQSRWSDAQQSYFRAYGAAPDNADYAFNLAVSLDKLSQPKLALEFYQRALALAQNKPGNFNKISIQERINQLQ